MMLAQRLEIVRLGIIAGAAGGLAEIAWVSAYSAFTGVDPAALARSVTTAAGVSALLPATPVALGIAVHMTLAVALGTALALVWQTARSSRIGANGPYPFMLAALAAVWAINFFVVLPIVSPAFIHMVPYAVSLTSKLLFGLAAAAVLQWRASSERTPSTNEPTLHAFAATSADKSDATPAGATPPPRPAPAGRAADSLRTATRPALRPMPGRSL